MSFQARSCDRLISPVRERNWKPTVFAIPRRNFDREFCHMRFAANRLASHLESCNRANWSTIRAKFKSRSRHASFRRGSRPRFPLPSWMKNWKQNPATSRNTRSRNNSFFLFFFLSSRNLIRVSVCLKENASREGILRFTGVVSFFLTSLFLLLLFLYISDHGLVVVKKGKNSRGIVFCGRYWLYNVI